MQAPPGIFPFCAVRELGYLYLYSLWHPLTLRSEFIEEHWSVFPLPAECSIHSLRQTALLRKALAVFSSVTVR